MRKINVNPHHSEEKINQELEMIMKAKEDSEYFAPLYEKYYEPISRYVHQKISDKQLADDVISQVFFKALNNLEKYEYRGFPLSAWLFRIAKSEVNQSFRDHRAKRNINIENVNIATFTEVFKDETTKLNKKILYHLLSQLNGRDLQLIELRYFENRAYKEIGELLDISENNAKVKTFRVLEKLKKLLSSVHVSFR